MFRLEMLPADDGDCLVLSWGGEGAVRHMVVDGGRAGTYARLRERLACMAKRREPVELFVLTHVDADHIEGALAMIRDPELPIVPRRVWYNGYDQMAKIEAYGEKQGDAYSAALAEARWPLNGAFRDGIVSIENAPAELVIEGLRVTLLSPDQEHLAAMRSRWLDWRDEQAARAAAKRLASPSGMVAYGREPVPETLDVEALSRAGSTDREPPNGSSIAFVAEFEGRRVLLAGDAHPDLLAGSLAPLAEAEGGRYRVDLFKVSHHGSRNNTTPELISMLDCRRFAISTNGTRHGHPDPEAVARMLRFSPDGSKRLYFNYEKERTLPWNEASLRRRWNYECVWPATEPGTIAIDIDPKPLAGEQ